MNCWPRPDQLGYQAESGPWRDVYLTGAYELRNGRPQSDQPRRDRPPAGRNPLPLFFASMAASLNGPRADGKQLLINFNFTDLRKIMSCRLRTPCCTTA